MSAEKKAKTGKRAAKHGVLASVHYYTTNLLKKAWCVLGRMPTQQSFGTRQVGMAGLNSEFTKLFQLKFKNSY